MIFEKAADIASHIIIDAPRLRDQHQHRVFDGPARGDQQFQHVVQTGRIALPGFDQRQDLFQVVAEHG